MLAGFLAESARRPFAWGEHDCCLWPADWLVARGYADPAAAYRDRYRTALGAQRILGREGGVLGVGLGMASRLGLQKTDEPEPGDVGVVVAETATGRRPVGAIRTGSHWAVLSERGLCVGGFEPLAAWRV